MKEKQYQRKVSMRIIEQIHPQVKPLCIGNHTCSPLS